MHIPLVWAFISLNANAKPQSIIVSWDDSSLLPQEYGEIDLLRVPGQTSQEPRPEPEPSIPCQPTLTTHHQYPRQSNRQSTIDSGSMPLKSQNVKAKKSKSLSVFHIFDVSPPACPKRSLRRPSPQPPNLQTNQSSREPLRAASLMLFCFRISQSPRRPGYGIHALRSARKIMYVVTKAPT